MVLQWKMFKILVSYLRESADKFSHLLDYTFSLDSDLAVVPYKCEKLAVIPLDPL